MRDTDYDVAVVGAGPAGSTVAHMLAENGLHVALIERRKTIGVPIQCGEYFPTSTECADLFPYSSRAKRIACIPSRFVTNQTYWTHLVSPFGNRTRFRFKANIIDRKLYDKHLVDEAIDSGAELYLDSSVAKRSSSNKLKIRKGNSTRTLSARVVVGADGPNSMISRSIGNILDSSAVSHSIQFVVKNTHCNPDVTEMYFGEQIAPGGYAWIIPKGDGRVNFGLGLRQHFNKFNTPLRVLLQHLMKHNPLISPLMRGGEIEQRVSALIPIGGPVGRTFSNNVLLVGDAASHVMASNGGGIPTAIIGGEIAAETILDHFSKSTPLSDYALRWTSEIGQTLSSAVAVRNIADSVLSNDIVTHICMSLAGPYLLESLIRCRLPFAVKLGSKILIPLTRILN
ncbi:MAG: Digeranylgeranylglycerophospholipid reductase [Candidatus Thorarchaeota archaeon]|nr:MAG: Digeranylgeranylglycerophospholipid reductase [Candidatus Thorarchaeota archaeon]